MWSFLLSCSLLSSLLGGSLVSSFDLFGARFVSARVPIDWKGWAKFSERIFKHCPHLQMELSPNVRWLDTRLASIYDNMMDKSGMYLSKLFTIERDDGLIWHNKPWAHLDAILRDHTHDPGHNSILEDYKTQSDMYRLLEFALCQDLGEKMPMLAADAEALFHSHSNDRVSRMCAGSHCFWLPFVVSETVDAFLNRYYYGISCWRMQDGDDEKQDICSRVNMPAYKIHYTGDTVNVTITQFNSTVQPIAPEDFVQWKRIRSASFSSIAMLCGATFLAMSRAYYYQYQILPWEAW